jgi:hypothetical protein
MPTVGRKVEKGYSAISGLALVTAAKSEDFPQLGSPTSVIWPAPSRSM